MIFQQDLDRAEWRQAEMAHTLTALRDSLAQVGQVHTSHVRFLADFEAWLALARQSDDTPPPFRAASSPGDWEYLVNPSDTDRHRTIRQNWSRSIDHLADTMERLRRKIQLLDERKFQLDFWILEKREALARLDPTVVRSQIRQVVEAGEELSTFILGREVEVAFDTRPNCPLGHVPIHKDSRSSRKVYLSAALLEEQSPHLLDLYRALIVHELGHLLLHLSDSDYRWLRRLLRKEISVAPGFFDVFNILLDQQLERVLRDTKPEWQTWFNRLDFHARRIPLRELRVLLARTGRGDPDTLLEDLQRRRLLKVYDDQHKPFATIQSGEIFSENLGFSRLYAFYAVFANKLPLASLREPWLRACLDLIPKDFKTLDILDLHALAVAIYKILMQVDDSAAFLRVEIGQDASGQPIFIEVPGTWANGGADGRGPVRLKESPRRSKKKIRGRIGPNRSSLRRQNRDRTVAPPANPEGEPPPPRVERERVVRRVPQPRPVVIPPGKSTGDVVLGEGHANRFDIPAWTMRQPRITRGIVRDTRRERRSKPTLTPEEKLHQKQRAGKLNAREKSRLRKQIQAGKPKPPQKSPQSLPPPKKPEKPREPKSPPSNPHTAALNLAHNLATKATPTWSERHALRGTNRELARILKEIRQERKKPIPKPLDRILPDRGQASDHRNESPVRAFPPAQQILRIKFDRRAHETLARAVRPLVPVLRPFFNVIEPERLPEDRLTGGRRLLGSGLMKHLAYGETRLFADLRFTETELHREIFFAVLIDTSASMQTDDRLSKAQRLATLLATCLRDCPEVETTFLAYNQNVYQCGTHEEPALTGLAPAGKTNEAAALDYLRTHHLGTPRRRKVVLVLSDGLPTACSVESVCWLVRTLQKEQGARLVYGAYSGMDHPAYARRVDLTNPLEPTGVRSLGRTLAEVLR